jgi:transcriptional regulator with XRE-family HTH domain
MRDSSALACLSFMFVNCTVCLVIKRFCMLLPSSTKAAVGRMSDRIRLARKAAKLSQAALAAHTAVTPSAAAQWEHPLGTRPNIENLQGIASATGASFEWLATGHGAHWTDRRRRNEFETPALALDAFAQNMLEETLLNYFRDMSSKSRELVVSVAAELATQHRQSR